MEFITNTLHLLDNSELLLISTWQTLYMTMVSTLLAYLVGIPLGIRH